MKPTNLLSVALLALFMGYAAGSWAQDKPASNLEIVHEKLKADKKLIVAKYMELTESEAQKFWPVYDEYQKDLQRSNERLQSLLESYAADYKGKSLTDEKAKKLLDDWMASASSRRNSGSAVAGVTRVAEAVPASNTSSESSARNL